MLVVKNKNGDKTYQFKLDKQLHVHVLLNMYIEVPGVYKQEHDARLVFSTPTQQDYDGKVTLYNDPKEIQGPKTGGKDVKPPKGQSSQGSDDKDDKKGNGKGNGKDKGAAKTSIKPEKAFAI